MTIYFTSDNHFGHKNIIKYCNRPFKHVDEMNEEMIARWNAKVGPEDEVYNLGDFSFDRNPAKFFNRLNGKKYLIKGNHDKKETLSLPWEEVSLDKNLMVGKQLIVLHHFAKRVWDGSHRGAWHLFGHSHGGLTASGLSFDAGVDCHDYTPISFEEVKVKMKELERNKNHSKIVTGKQ